MNNKNKMAIILAIATIAIVPNLALAVWWNPFTWFTKKIVEKPIVSDFNAKSVVSNTELNLKTSQNKENNTSDKKKDDFISQKELKKDSPITINTNNKVIPTQEKQNIIDSPRSLLIAEFLKNPTLENLNIFCVSAKNIEGITTKQVLDSNREKIITIKSSLYEEMPDCQNINKTKENTAKYYLPLKNKILNTMYYPALNKTSYPVYYFNLNDSLFVTIQSNDSDILREAKILYNDKIKSLIIESKVKFILFKGRPDISHPSELFKMYMDMINKQKQRIIDVNNSTQTEELKLERILSAKNVIENYESQLKSIPEKDIIDVSKNFK